MKKLFYIAGLAIIAIGGAVSTNSFAADWEGQSGTVYHCNGAGALCRTNISENVRPAGSTGAFQSPLTTIPANQFFN
ncbi:hypothetical protein [Pedobacter hartonius]|uniref:Uncharacterized protein n=1 Tax=Pedobacter hartonius TaxID=425514 RepID=A0A1H4CYQ5_9SPHI|nr:hypothetical protein [Pedobacter hartonius]SEA65349.1 hypothetical protein SAMN05443550_104247 [Pedobacter hartonius]